MRPLKSSFIACFLFLAGMTALPLWQVPVWGQISIADKIKNQDAAKKAREANEKRLKELGPATKGRAKLTKIDKKINVSGTVNFSEVKDGVEISAFIVNIPMAGKYGFLVHAGATCGEMDRIIRIPDYARYFSEETANIVANENGQAVFRVILPGVSLTQAKSSIMGKTITVHEKEFQYDGTGMSAGNPIACGRIHPVW